MSFGISREFAVQYNVAERVKQWLKTNADHSPVLIEFELLVLKEFKK